MQRAAHRPPGSYREAVLFNNIFPIKDSVGNTARIVVGGAGYVYAWDVDYQQILP